MAKRITNEDIERINEAYLHFGTYAAAARAVGCSPSTVKKYVVEDYKPVSRPTEVRSISFPPIEEVIKKLQNGIKLSCLTPREKQDLKEVWRGMNF